MLQCMVATPQNAGSNSLSAATISQPVNIVFGSLLYLPLPKRLQYCHVFFLNAVLVEKVSGEFSVGASALCD